MPENLLHYIWYHRLFYPNGLHTTKGIPVEVVNTGTRNTDAGPDFFNAKVKIGDTLWAGCVEIHLRSSEWYKHRHHTNRLYNNVILHVVAEADTEITCSNSEQISQVVLRFPDKILQNYEHLLANKRQIACEEKIAQVPVIVVNSWKSALLAERLAHKTAVILGLLTQNTNNWEDTFYTVLARNFGFGTNSEPFELLARSLPQNILVKHKDNLLQIEALLFGQAGLLPAQSTDSYILALKKEYVFLQQKYALKSIDGALWKLLRLRPDNFPHIRLAQFAVLVYRSSKLFSKILENPHIEFLRHLFDCEPSVFWETHYRFESQSPAKIKKMSRQTIDILLINTIVPMLFAYAEKKQNASLKEKALALLEQIPTEKNAVVQHWNALDVASRSASDSQALLQLQKHYCAERKCLHCRIGHQILAKKTD